MGSSLRVSRDRLHHCLVEGQSGRVECSLDSREVLDSVSHNLTCKASSSWLGYENNHMEEKLAEEQKLLGNGKQQSKELPGGKRGSVGFCVMTGCI